MIEELEEGEGQRGAEGQDVREVLSSDLRQPGLVVAAVPALDQLVAGGQGILVVPETLVDGVELCPGGQDGVANQPGFLGTLAPVELVDPGEGGLLVLAGEEGVADCEDLLDHFPGELLVEDVPGLDGGVLLHHPLPQLQHLLLGLREPYVVPLQRGDEVVVGDACNPLSSWSSRKVLGSLNSRAERKPT
jgi:hypothetical protein